MTETVIPAKQSTGISCTAQLAAAASCRNQLRQPAPPRTVTAMPALPAPQLASLGCKVLQRAAQGLLNPAAFQRSTALSSEAKLASFSTSQGQIRETQHRVCSTSVHTIQLPGTKHLPTTTTTSFHSVTSSQPPSHSAHTLPVGYQPPAPVSCHSKRGGDGSSTQPKHCRTPAHPDHLPARHHAYSAVRPAGCLATETGDGRDEGNFSPFHASFLAICSLTLRFCWSRVSWHRRYLRCQDHVSGCPMCHSHAIATNRGILQIPSF